jgi:PAS domain S-box-containing protein
VFKFVLVALLFCLHSFLYAEEKIRFGVFAYLGYEKTKEKFEPLVEYLNTKLTKTVLLEVLTHEEMNQKIKNKELDIATTNPTHFLVIRNSEKLSGALATEIGFSNNIATDKLAGIILVNKDSKINSLKDIKHKKIAIPSLEHMGGFRAQAYELYLNDIDANKNNEIVISNIHQEAVKKLLAKEVDVAFAREGIYEQMIADGELKADDVKIINEQTNSSFPFKISTQLYPQWPIFALPSAKEEDIKELIQALYSFDSNSIYAKKSRIYGYNLPADYLVVENMARALRLPPYENIGQIYTEDIWEQSKVEIIIFFILIMLVALIYVYARNKRKIIEEKIRLEKDFISTIIDNANTIIAVIDSKGVMYKVNKFAKEFTGYSEDEIKSEPYFWKRFLPMEVQDKVFDIIKNANKGIINKNFQNSWISKNGEEKIFEWSNALIQHPDGTMNYLVTVGIDITKQNEQLKIIQEKNYELQKTQLKFQTLFEESLDGIVLMDSQTQKFIEFNHHAYEMYGYTKEEFALLKVNDIDVLHDDKQIIATQQAILKNGWDKFTTKHIAKDGTIKDIIVSVKAFIIDDKHILHATFHDITEQKRKESMLKKLLSEQEALFKVQTAGFVHLKERHFEWTNETFETMLGYEKGELQGQPSRIMYQDEAEYISYGKDGYEALNSTGIFTREINCVKKDGTHLYLLASMTSLHKDSTEAVGIAFDISDIKIQSKLIEQQKEEFETIFKYSNDGIAILDLESNFLDFNEAYRKMIGFSREELLKQSCIGLTVPEDREKSLDAFKYVLEYGHVENVEKVCAVKDGKRITVNMSASLLPDNQRFLLLTKDVTNLKVLEEQSKLASMGEMIGNIAHQWRQPLSVISTNSTGLIMQQEYGLLNDKLLIASCNQINDNAQYLSKTIDDFRNFIKGDTNLDFVNVSEIVNDSLNILKGSLSNHYVNLVLTLEDDLKLYTNRNEFVQAIINIVNNAKDAVVENVVEEDRVILISTKKIDDKNLELKICDNGGGIPQNIITKIFEPYFTTKHKSRGTGLGLSMVNQIIREKYNQKLNVYNNNLKYNGKEFTGACFTIVFIAEE